jgi:hypothetical protein
MIKCLFIHMPRTGGNSINAACTQAATRSSVAWASPRTWSRASEFVTFSHWPIRELLRFRILRQSDLDDRFAFTFVRNPWDRLVSFYHYARRHPGLNKLGPVSRDFNGFANFICTGRFPVLGPYNYSGLSQARPQSDWLRDVDCNIYRFERLAAEWERLCGDLGIAGTLPHKSESVGRKQYSAYYDDDTADNVGAFYREDIERFGYEYLK